MIELIKNLLAVLKEFFAGKKIDSETEQKKIQAISEAASERERSRGDAEAIKIVKASESALRSSQKKHRMENEKSANKNSDDDQFGSDW